MRFSRWLKIRSRSLASAMRLAAVVAHALRRPSRISETTAARSAASFALASAILANLLVFGSPALADARREVRRADPGEPERRHTDGQGQTGGLFENHRGYDS